MAGMPADPVAIPPADLLPVQRRATLAYRVARIVLLPALHALFRLDIRGRERVPSRGAFLIIANHLNWLDSFAILAALPAEPRVHFLGDPTLLRTHRLQWLIVRAVGGYIPVDRQKHGDPQLYDHVDRCLQAGGVAALYPEGHYGPGEGRLLPFHTGFAHFAIDNRVPVVPIGLTGTQDLWWRKRIGIRIGDPIDPAGRSVESLLGLGRDRVLALLEPSREPAGLKLFRRWLTRIF
jgi:1-acyl-sn-glycerol-3-phosphate acyltransferase